MKNISFLKFYRTFIFLSLSLIIVSIFFLFNKGLNLGVDFKGGTLLEIQVTKTTSSESIRSQFIDLNLGDVKVKEFGDSNIFLAILEKKNNEKQYINNLKKNLEKKTK